MLRIIQSPLVYKNSTTSIPNIKQYREKTINKLVGCMLLITAIFLLSIHKFGYTGKRSTKNLNLFKARYVITPLIKKEIKYGNHRVCKVFDVMKSFNLRIIAPILTGINMKNEKSRADF